MTLTVVVTVLGLLSSGVAGGLLALGQRDSAQQQLERRTTLVAGAVSAEAGRYVDALRTVAAAAGAFTTLTREKFDEATRPLGDMRLAGATSIAFLVPARGTELAAVQAVWRARGAPGLVLRPVGGATEHIFSVFTRPLDGGPTPRGGIDVTQSAIATRALIESRRAGRPTVSDPYQLIIDQRLPRAQRQMSFILTAPVHSAPDAAGQRTFRGWVLLGLRGRDFISATLTRVSQGLIDVSLRAPAADGSWPLVATHRADAAGGRDLSRRTEIAVADQRWRLDVEVDGRDLPGGTTGLPTVVTGAGIVLTLMLAGLVHSLATGRARARAQIRAATAELAATEAAARRQADLLTAIMDSISDGVGVVDTDGQFLLHNPAAKAMLGLEVDVDGAENWQQHYGMFRPDGRTPFPAEDMPLVRALAGRASDQVEMVIRNHVNPDGLSISVSGRPLHSSVGQIGAVAVFHDITARKAAEAQLRTARDALADQKAYLTQVLDAIEVMVVTCDTNGAIVHANLAARRAVPDIDLAGTLITVFGELRLTYPDGTSLPLDDTPLMQVMHGKPVDAMEAVMPLPDGTHRVLLLHARPLHDAAGTLIGAVSSSYDITALREREADLRAFAAVAAHDLKAPLSAVAGYAELLDEDLPEDAHPELRFSLDRVRAGVDRMRRLIDDLLAYATARDATLNLETVDLQQLVADVIAERTAHLRAGVDSHGRPTPFPDIYTGPLPPAHADPAMIRQLVDNLIGNALKYALPGQPPRIDISAVESADDHHIQIQIADRGIGIPDAEKPHVFASFRRAGNHGDRPGTGLGLAICQRIIDRHGGTITVSDNPGGGTRILFTLPAAVSVARTSSSEEPRLTRHHGDS